MYINKIEARFVVSFKLVLSYRLKMEKQPKKEIDLDLRLLFVSCADLFYVQYFIGRANKLGKCIYTYIHFQ